MKKRLQLLFLFCILFLESLTAQREYNVYDSTFYTLNNDTTIIAGKRQLYWLVNNTATPLHDFTTPDTNYYIRDFDIINDYVWYTLVGSRYISNETFLYKSIDKGNTWALDTSYYAVVPPDSLSGGAFTTYNGINQIQELGEDTVALLIGYYSSAVVYSYNAGQNWNWWFESMHAHYGGFLSCDTTYYLWGWAGDGFSAYMFAINKSALFTAPYTYTYCQPTPPGNNSCVRAIGAPSRYLAYVYFDNFIDSICSAPINTVRSWETDKTAFTLYPNPLQQGNALYWSSQNMLSFKTYAIRNDLGQVLYQGTSTASPNAAIQLPALPQGHYFITFYGEQTHITKTFIVY